MVEEEKRRPGRPPKTPTTEADLVAGIEEDLLEEKPQVGTKELTNVTTRVAVLNCYATYQKNFPGVQAMIDSAYGQDSAVGGVTLPPNTIIASKPIKIGGANVIVSPEAVEHIFANERERTYNFHNNGVTTRRAFYNFHGE